MRKSIILAGVLFAAEINFSQAQPITDPGDYMTRISGAQTEMDQKYMAYISAAAHSRRARKIERMRTAALESINNAKYKTSDLPVYKGDNSLRQAGIDYIQFCYRIFSEDYSKIVDIEEIAEQSIDEMQVYLLLQEKTSEKLREASGNFNKAQNDFATKYNVKVVDSKGELYEKMKTADKLNHYCNQVFLLFFKANYEENALFKAVADQKLIAAEQARSALLGFATEGLETIKADSLRSFQGDAELGNGCREILVFYKSIAEKDVPKLMDFYLKQENFEKLKKAMDAKGSSRTKQDVEAFNKSAKEMNAGVTDFNFRYKDLFKQRQAALDAWNAADRSFRDRETPYYKK